MALGWSGFGLFSSRVSTACGEKQDWDSMRAVLGCGGRVSFGGRAATGAISVWVQPG